MTYLRINHISNKGPLLSNWTVHYIKQIDFFLKNTNCVSQPFLMNITWNSSFFRRKRFLLKRAKLGDLLSFAGHFVYFIWSFGHRQVKVSPWFFTIEVAYEGREEREELLGANPGGSASGQGPTWTDFVCACASISHCTCSVPSQRYVGLIWSVTPCA